MTVIDMPRIMAAHGNAERAILANASGLFGYALGLAGRGYDLDPEAVRRHGWRCLLAWWRKRGRPVDPWVWPLEQGPSHVKLPPVPGASSPGPSIIPSVASGGSS